MVTPDLCLMCLICFKLEVIAGGLSNGLRLDAVADEGVLPFCFSCHGVCELPLEMGRLTARDSTSCHVMVVVAAKLVSVTMF